MKKEKKNSPPYVPEGSDNSRSGTILPDLRGNMASNRSAVSGISSGNMKSTIQSMEILEYDYLKNKRHSQSAERYTKIRHKKINKSDEGRFITVDEPTKKLPVLDAVSEACSRNMDRREPSCGTRPKMYTDGRLQEENILRK
jgi:hypothetical protein